MTRRYWFIIGVMFLFLALGLWVVGTIRNGSATARATLAPTSPSISDSTVTAKGSIVPSRYARLSFGVGGTVAQLFVKAGDKVKAGDVLAQARTPATADEISVADANYRTAQANYDRAKNGVAGSELEILRATLSKAEAAMQMAQAAYDRIGGASNPMIGMLP